MHYRMFSRILGFYPLDASRTSPIPSSSCDNQKCLNLRYSMCPGVKTITRPSCTSPIKNHCIILLLSFIYITDLLVFLAKRNRKKAVCCLRSQALGSGKSWFNPVGLLLLSFEVLGKSLKFVGQQGFFHL